MPETMYLCVVVLKSRYVGTTFASLSSDISFEYILYTYLYMCSMCIQCIDKYSAFIIEPVQRIELKILYEERVSILRLNIFKLLHSSYGPRLNCEKSFGALASLAITRIYVLVQFLLANNSNKT